MKMIVSLVFIFTLFFFFSIKLKSLDVGSIFTTISNSNFEIKKTPFLDNKIHEINKYSQIDRRFKSSLNRVNATKNERLIGLSILICVIAPFLYAIYIGASKNSKKTNSINKIPISLFTNLVDFFYSPKVQKEVFQPISADWQEEYFEALFKKEIWKARWINVRYTYAFLAAMWMKSPIGDLIQFVIKIAKQ